MQTFIRHIPRHELDTEAYNRCISNASNGVIYAQSRYLDAMADNWDVLVAGNYEAVMPLPWRKKYSIRYGYMPAYTAMLGVFTTKPDAGTVAQFLEAAARQLRFFDYSLNPQNCFPVPGFRLASRVNYVLDLSSSYTELYSRYRQNIQRNIKKAENLGCVIRKNIPVQDVIVIADSQLSSKTNLTAADFTRFEKLFHLLKDEGKAVTYGVYSAKDELLASCALFFSAGRAYYILVGNHPNGRTLGASHALIDAFIRDYAGNNLILDFEGSDFRNLAFFYNSFGAKEEAYCGVNCNRLPWWAKLFKK